MSTVYSRIIKEISAFIFPQECAFCNRELLPEEPLCRQCIELIRPTLSTRISIGLDKTLQIYALGAYEEPLKTLILGKHRSHFKLSKHLGTLIWRFSPLTMMKADYLVPVPLHRRRYALRGYNQAYIIAQRLSDLSGIPVFEGIMRIRNTKPQSRCKSYERYANVEGAFMVSSDICLQGKHLVIIDDMVTSGATIAEVARVLIPYNLASLKAIVACGQSLRQ